MNLNLTGLFKKFYIDLIIGLMKVLVGLLNQSSLNTLIFQFLDHYWKIQFKNYFKQIPAPFKIHADFECILKSLESNEDSCSKKHQDQILAAILEEHE